MAIKATFSGLFFFWTSCCKGASPRDFLINEATCLNIIKLNKVMDKNLSEPVKILISEQTTFAIVIHFGQVFVFCSLINKNVLEWFLLTICKEHTLQRSTNLLSRNHLTLCFWLRRESRQIPNTKQWTHWQMQPQEVLYERSCSQKFSNNHRKTPVLESFS